MDLKTAGMAAGGGLLGGYILGRYVAPALRRKIDARKQRKAAEGEDVKDVGTVLAAKQFSAKQLRALAEILEPEETTSEEDEVVLKPAKKKKKKATKKKK